ncbi:MAG: tetratricopeptide repeat protein, partial [Cyanobacteria bacterium HKST-UBA01]|nr:tetratricopeptide repeat protein [Cyanobacteria bacterium HKST-UBA01]
QMVAISVCAATVIGIGSLYFANPTFKSLVDSAGQQIQWQYESSLGFIACTLRDFEAAEAHYRKSLSLADNMTSSGERHVKRLASLEALAGALQYQAKYQEKDRVVELHKKELRKSLGDLATVEDEETDLNLSVDPDNEEQALANMRIFDKLGKESARMGKTDTAARYLARSYEIKRKWLKEGDESLIRTMDDLAKIYVIQNKRHQAGGLWMESFRQAEKYLPDDSTVKISLYDNMGRIHQDKGRPEKAEYCFKRALELAKRHYGKNNRTTIEVTKDYAAFLNQVGRKTEAEKLWTSINAL